MMVSIPKISPNLLLGVGGIIAAVFLVSQIRKAGAGVQDALSGIQLPSIGDITFPEIKFPEIKFPDFFPSSEPVISADPTKQTPEQQEELFGRELTNAEQDEINRIAKQIEAGQEVTPSGFDPNADSTRFLPPVGEPQFTGREKDRAAFEAGLIDQFSIPIKQVAAGEDISGSEFAQAESELAFRESQQEKIVQPFQQFQGEVTQEQILASPAQLSSTEILASAQERTKLLREAANGGLGFNPVNTLSEVINLFPELSASQARNFLFEFGSNLSPEEALRLRPDVRNITSPFGQIDTSASISDLESENIRAAKFTCKNFGLNCELADSSMA